MNSKQVAGILDRLLKYCLVGVLSFSTLMFFFVFVINWEDRFFGIKLDGLPAGLYLLAKWLIAGALAVTLIKNPRYSLHLAAVAGMFYGWLLVDSSITIQRNGTDYFSPVLAVCFLVAVVFLIVHAIAARHCETEEDE
ncbi:MAG: hypothetical protein LUQ01_00460 [Methanolinea sp.]|nr:hypothetical protein [Methanolinea sp.]